MYDYTSLSVTNKHAVKKNVRVRARVILAGKEVAASFFLLYEKRQTRASGENEKKVLER